MLSGPPSEPPRLPARGAAEPRSLYQGSGNSSCVLGELPFVRASANAKPSLLGRSDAFSDFVGCVEDFGREGFDVFTEFHP